MMTYLVQYRKDDQLSCSLEQPYDINCEISKGIQKNLGKIWGVFGNNLFQDLCLKGSKTSLQQVSKLVEKDHLIWKY